MNLETKGKKTLRQQVDFWFASNPEDPVFVVTAAQIAKFNRFSIDAWAEIQALDTLVVEIDDDTGTVTLRRAA